MLSLNKIAFVYIPPLFVVIELNVILTVIKFKVLASLMNNTLFIIAVAIVLSLGLMFYPTIGTAQENSSQQSTGGQQSNVPLSFFLKFKDDSKNATASGNQSQAKNATITVTIQKGPGGSPVKLPVSAMVPAGTEAKDLELCASIKGGKETCQPLDKKDAKLDLSSQGQSNLTSSNMSSTPTEFNPNTDLSGLVNSIVDWIPVQTANAQLITIDDTTLNIPITVIVPITLQIQNAQVCASVASSGDQTCQQIVLQPTQTSYTPVDIDLSTGTTPTVSTDTTQPALSLSTSTGGSGSNETTTSPEGTSDTSSASSGSGGSSSNDTGSDSGSDTGTTTEQQGGNTESNGGDTNNGDSTQSGDSTSGTN
jgi:hypothetical protein